MRTATFILAMFGVSRASRACNLEPKGGYSLTAVFLNQLAWSLHLATSFKVRCRGSVTKKGEEPMLWTILVILLVLWLLGFIGHVGGRLIHLLLAVALIVFIINIVSGRRAV